MSQAGNWVLEVAGSALHQGTPHVLNETGIPGQGRVEGDRRWNDLKENDAQAELHK